jgi:membrane protein insertase Oxa1/YidC/SpoIIIJ
MKNAIILNIIHNIFNLRGTGVAIFIITVLLRFKLTTFLELYWFYGFDRTVFEIIYVR